MLRLTVRDRPVSLSMRHGPAGSARPGSDMSCRFIPRAAHGGARRRQGEPRAMADYDPRTATGIPTEPVGSLPRPSRLQQAYAQYDEGQITREQLETEQDMAVRDSIEHLETTGAPIISDGEQRWSSFATYAITDTLAGTGLADHLAGSGGQYFAIFADGHKRQLPRLTGGPFRYKTYAADTLKKSIAMAHKPMKQA